MSNSGLTVEQWETKEQEYETLVQDIILTPNLDANDIKVLISKLDRALSKARFDFARSKISYERIQRQNKALQKELFLQAKRGEAEDLGDARVSDEVAKAWSEVALNRAADPSPVWVENECMRRFNFMQAVIGILDDKRQMLITDQGVLKLEASML